MSDLGGIQDEGGGGATLWTACCLPGPAGVVARNRVEVAAVK